MVPTREEAHRILEEAEPHNPGPWVTMAVIPKINGMQI